MNILIVGGGGREHALAWKISQSPRADRVFVAPGNAGTAVDAENVDISDCDIPALLEFAKQNNVAMTLVGPEAPLAAGIVDAFQAEKLRIFGPSRAAAELEASKVFCKKLLHGADVPSAEFRTFDQVSDALKYIRARENKSVVVKADGLAAGKGVIVCAGQGEAVAAIKMIGAERAFGEAGNRLVIEERLVGQEVSVLAITDGRTIFTLQPAQDHKPANDGDTGPNTGGMGAYCPTPAIDESTLHWVEEHVLVPTVHAMKLAGRDFCGVLYAGLMMTAQGPKVLEYNVRFGDPECQPLLMRLKTDLLDVIEATVDGRLSEIDPPVWDERPAVCVVMASEGYPGTYTKGRVISGLAEAAALTDVKVFHAGTKTAGEQTVSNGGRVLGVTALGSSIAAAKLQAYAAVKCIRWEGAWCRTDIADKAIFSI